MLPMLKPDMKVARPEKRPVPATVSFSEGVVVPIPTLPTESITRRAPATSLTFSSWITNLPWPNGEEPPDE